MQSVYEDIQQYLCNVRQACMVYVQRHIHNQSNRLIRFN